MTRIEIVVEQLPDGKCRVLLTADNKGDPPPFIDLMCAAEYLCAVAASESNAGYEKGLELIVQGAMTYRHMYRERRDP